MRRWGRCSSNSARHDAFPPELDRIGGFRVGRRAGQFRPQLIDINRPGLISVNFSKRHLTNGRELQK